MTTKALKNTKEGKYIYLHMVHGNQGGIVDSGHEAI